MSEKRQSQTTVNIDWKGIVALVVVGLGLLASAVVLAWKLAQTVEPDIARAWALIATALLPVATIAGHRLAHAEAKGRLQGIDDGLDKVVNAAHKATDLRVTNVVRMKEATQQPAPFVVLPPPEAAFTMRPQLTSGEVIEVD